MYFKPLISWLGFESWAWVVNVKKFLTA